MNGKPSKATDVPDEMLQAYRILKDPVLWGEKFLYNSDGTQRTFWNHQIEDLCNASCKSSIRMAAR